ncbi:lytic transglycosylase domain-containing protein [Jannaschia aquimarina]|uniref:Slt_3 protein n=1 Tax=Jannaschia aquimarina TaxID=935700 RepID=A0A0D1D9J9_9RHOB|nr:lytic transglycosylase domain-containing protein [Jannaschia aquimarina]KIT16573.1 Soluble lytic murein transglycosylase precursor [Jannaschia aquimarina]SNT41661.1 Type IV secretion system protein [Jannaschia aquimarina]
MGRLLRTPPIAAAALAALCHSSLAQGVPTIDGRTLAEKLQAYLHLERDEDTQVAKAQNRADIQDFKAQQLDALDRMIEAFGSVPTMTAAFTGGGARYEGVEEVYGPVANPAGRFVFGDAREDIEQLIIRGAADTYGEPGVGRAGLSPLQWRCLLQALIWQESRFQVGARSPADAFGLTQIIPGTARYLGVYPDYYTDPYLQVVGGGRYLAEQLQRFDGNIIFALGAYNAGPGRIIEYGGVPPFRETQHYVQVIPEKYNSYLRTIGGAEALGTLDPAEYAVANASLLSDGSMHYAGHSLATARQALMRVRALVAQISDTNTAKQAMDLNTAIRAEVTLIVAARLRTKAARTQSEYSQVAAQLTRQREAMAFVDFSTPEF